MTLQADLDLTADFNSVNVVNGLHFDGTATAGSFAFLNFIGTQTFSGTGTVVFENVAVNGIRLAEDDMTLTIGENLHPDAAIRKPWLANCGVWATPERFTT